MGCFTSKNVENLYKIDKNFSFDGYECFAKCVSVYDGDTVTIIFYHNKIEIPIQLNVRIIGYDSPEMHPKKKNRTQESLDEEKRRATIAKTYVETLILNKKIYVKFYKYDKYGRPLVDIIINNMTLTKIMLDGGYGVPHDGGKKIIQI